MILIIILISIYIFLGFITLAISIKEEPFDENDTAIYLSILMIILILFWPMRAFKI